MIRNTIVPRVATGIVASLALLLAACGGGSSTDLATIDGQNTERTTADAEAQLDTDAAPPVLLEAGETTDVDPDLPVPDAAAPPVPGPASSPAQRQQLQELGLVEGPAAPTASAPAPSADAADPTDGPAAGSGDAVRPDLDLFPSEIPAVVPGAPGASTSTAGANAAAPLPAAGFVATPDGDGESTGAEDELYGVSPDAGVERVVTEAPVTPADGDGADGLAEAGVTDCLVDDCAPEDDIALASGSGIGDSGRPVDGADPSASTSDGEAPGDGPDCERRPYDRGCPLPADGAGGIAWDADLEDDDDIDSGGAGVDVPQDVIDALLAPVDGEGDEGDEDGEGDDADGEPLDGEGGAGSTEEGDATDPPATSGNDS